MEFASGFLIEFLVFCLNIVFYSFLFAFCLSIFRYFLVDRQQNQQIRQEWLQRVDEIVHRVDVEKHGEIYYWYDADDGEFLGQGRSEQECINHVRGRFPTHLFLFTNNKYIKAPDWDFKNYTVQK